MCFLVNCCVHLYLPIVEIIYRGFNDRSHSGALVSCRRQTAMFTVVLEVCSDREGFDAFSVDEEMLTFKESLHILWQCLLCSTGPQNQPGRHGNCYLQVKQYVAR